MNAKEWAHSCLRKRRFGSLEGAEQVITRAKVRGKQLRPYYCHECGGFHLASVKQPAGRRA